MLTASATASATPPAAAPASHSSRLTLLWLAAVFVLPFVVGSGLFWLDWRPAKYGNHGELLQPARALPETGLRHSDGRPLPTAELRGKWLLVMRVQAACDGACLATLQQMAQVHLALNQEQARVQRVLLVSDSDPENLTQAQRRFPDLVVASVPSNSTAWDSTLDDRATRLYVVDPLANVMLRYADPSDMRGVLKDLERLLKYSWLR